MQNRDTMIKSTRMGMLACMLVWIAGLGEVVMGQQVWTYDFGDGTGTHSSGESTSFLPSPQTDGGTARVRIGTADGTISLESSAIGSFSQIKMVASSSSSSNYAQIFDYLNPDQVFYTNFSFRISGGNSGQFTFIQGNGSSFSGNSAFGFSSSDTFTGLRWTLESDGSLTTERRTGSSWSGAGGLDQAFVKDQVYSIEVYGNNSSSSKNYYKNGEEFTVASDRWSLWIDGTHFDDVVTGAYADESDIDSFMFGAFNSTNNEAEIEIDDIVYSNSLPDIRRIDNFANYSTDGEWRMLSLPYDATVEQLARQNLVQGIPGSFPGAGANIFTSQNGTGEAGAQDSDWIAPTGLSETIERGQGFIWLLFDNALIPENKPLPLDLTVAAGANNNADLSVPLASGNDGWNLLGNPFSDDLSVVDIASWSLNSGSLTSSIVQVYDPESDSYEVLNQTTDKVASFQGFFLQNNDATAITIPATARSSGATFYKKSDRKGLISLQVQSDENSAGQEFTDSALELFFSDRAEHGWDLWDASKLTPLSNQHIGMAFGGYRNNNEVLKAQDSRPYNLKEPITIPADFFSAGVDGSAEISVTEITNLPDGWSVEIEDTFTGNRQVLDEHSNFRFDYTATQASKDMMNGEQAPPVIQSVDVSSESPRFLIHVSPGPAAASTLPSNFTLNQNYPNPFNPTTVISYDLPVNSQVNLAVYDMMGRRVATLVNENVTAGTHQVQFDASSLSSGTYMYRLQAGGNIQTKKLTLIK